MMKNIFHSNYHHCHHHRFHYEFDCIMMIIIIKFYYNYKKVTYLSVNFDEQHIMVL